ncbi:MAG: hypothetical protein ACTHZ5_09040 [Micrococcaceae bacterium]
MTDIFRRGGALLLALMLTMTGAVLSAAPATAQNGPRVAQSQDDPEGLVVVYPDGSLSLDGLAPGGRAMGQAQITNRFSESAEVFLTVDAPIEMLDQAMIDLSVQLCTQAWTSSGCEGTVTQADIETGPRPAVVGELGADQTWYVLVEASMAANAPNDAQNRAENFDLNFSAQADGAPGEEPTPEPDPDTTSSPTPEPTDPGPVASDDDDLAVTGFASLAVMLVALLLIAVGAVLYRRRRSAQQGIRS